MRRLDYCRVMEGIAARPLDKVQLTIGQFLELREHLKECHKCATLQEAVLRDNPGARPSNFERDN